MKLTKHEICELIALCREWNLSYSKIAEIFNMHKSTIYYMHKHPVKIEPKTKTIYWNGIKKVLRTSW